MFECISNIRNTCINTYVMYIMIYYVYNFNATFPRHNSFSCSDNSTSLIPEQYLS